ncbi:YceI family protein [Mesonia aestuariivivens]|uniref:YceI family protein n=1 Tax=Mesonia aestuariivivens TaxID=2796128 RepID=A0ABS6W2P7_9FLAO|nr:YceI family protein [Mesonia aestuariivivens]MBW2962137.1 YceI family protein [Mesonia aestuariivivens]
MMKTILTIFFFFSLISAYAQSGIVNIEVRTNVNKFNCSCKEESFICQEFTAQEKVLKLPVASFDCPKRMIEKDLIELFEAEKYPHIAIEILNYTESNGAITASIKITVKKTAKVYQLQLGETYDSEAFYFTGTQELDLTDYHIEPPVKALGLVKVKPVVTIEFKIPEEFVIN